MNASSSSIRRVETQSALFQPGKVVEMKSKHMTRVSLDELEAMNAEGQTHHNPDAIPGQSLGPEFWASAECIKPEAARPVLLKVDPEVFEFFKAGGKGHLTRMQNVLRAYVRAQKQSRTMKG
jgi:uncharacterized protein (DUF4415 family)